jgi:SAM-dependent methyltransferase
MNFVERIHGGYVHDRRVHVLKRELSAHLPSHGRVLDVGCGDGLLASMIKQAKPNLSITGIDVLLRESSRIPISKFNGREIPFADASFDAVMFVDVLHHTEEPEVLLKEALRVTRATIVLKDHTRDGVLADATLRFMDRIGNQRHNVALPYNYWPERKWRDTFAALGLKVRRWQSRLGLYPLPADWVFGRSLHFIATLERDRAD